ncbi:hypothetical protein [Prevotella sp. MA2016]|nr:hypothetical protein [Prevotella sp. MA2016]
MKRLRLGAVLHFLIAIGHIGCLFALDEALAVSMISPGYNVSHPSFPPL